MWKYFHRGVWETIDCSVNVLKADPSNGACIVSNLVSKDLVDLSPQANIKSKCSHCNNDGSGDHTISGKNKLPHKHPPLVHRASEKVVKSCKVFPVKSHDFCRPKTSTPLQIFTESQIPSTKGYDCCNVTLDNCDKASRSISCSFYKKCNGSNEGGHICLYAGKPQPPLSLSNKLFSNSNINALIPVVPNAIFKKSDLKTLSSEHSSPNFDASEGSKLFKSSPLISSKCNLSLSTVHYNPSSSHVSFLLPNHTIKEKKKSQISLNHACRSSSESQSYGKSTYCLLKLPFLSHNLGSFKGLNRFSACWLSKSRSEFGRDDSRGQGSDGRGESEEAKQDAWRHYQSHQSLLEALGWSSALVLGWFLGQCRIWHICGEGQNTDGKAGEKKQCIAGTIAGLLVSWGNNPCSYLNILPSETSGRVRERKRKKESSTSSINDLKVKPSNGGSEGYFSDVVTDVNDPKRLSSNYGMLLQSSETLDEAAKYPKNHLKQEFSSLYGERKKSVIVMPWHADSKEKLTFGPITLDEALKEAEKGLEEAQAEVLLVLALEKLDESENSSHSGLSAAELFDSAARLGSAAAAFNLGICYEMGVGGVTKDITQAYHWYKQASDYGHAAATYNLAVFHAHGLAGLCPDTHLANELLERASYLGQPEATNALALLTSLKPTESHCNNKKNSIHETCGTLSNQQKCELVAPDNSRPQHISRTSDVSYSKNSNDASKPSIHTSLKKGSSSSSWPEDTSRFSLKLDHLIESFSLPLSKLDDSEDSLVDVLFDNIQGIKRRDLDYNSIKLGAQ